MIRRDRLSTALFLVFTATLLGLAIGCGDASPKNTVSGKVSYKGQLLNTGSIEFHGLNHVIRGSSIGPDGTYAIADVPVGENTVTVKVPTPVAPPPGVKMPGSDIIPVKVPPQYASATTSGVKQTVAAGKTTVDIDLK